MARATGSTNAESPTATLNDDHDDELDDAERQPADPSPADVDEDTAPPAEAATEPADKEPSTSVDEPTKPAKTERNLDPKLQEAVDRLSKREDATEEAPKPKAKAKAPAATDAAKPDAKAKGSRSADEDAFAGMSPEARAKAQGKGETRERIETLFKRARTAETEIAAYKGVEAKLVESTGLKLEEVLPHAQTGKRVADIFAGIENPEDRAAIRSEFDHVSPPELVGAIAATAAAERVAKALQSKQQPNAADLETLKPVRDALDQIFGAVEGPRVTGLPKFEGALPKDLADRVAVEDLTKEEAEVLAAQRAFTTAQAERSKEPAKPVAPARQPARERAPAPQQQPRADRASQQADSMIVAHLTKQGVGGPNEVRTHFQKNLLPIVSRLIEEELPGVAFEDVEPGFRVELTKRAQKEFQAKAQKRSAPADDEEATAPSLKTGQGRTPRTGAAAAGGESFLDAIVDHLSRD